MTRLDGKIALITGSTDGVGRVVATRLGAAGAHVLAHGRDRARGERVVADIQAAGGRVDCLIADLASLAEVRRLAEIYGRATTGWTSLSTMPALAPPAQRGRPVSTATSCASPSTTSPASC